MSIWVITRTPRLINGKTISMWDPDTGGVRFGEILGFVEGTLSDVERIRRRYEATNGWRYHYRRQELKELRDWLHGRNY